MSKIEYKVLPLFPEQVTSVNRLDPRDVELVGDYKVNNVFSTINNSIELHAYSQTGILLKSDYNYKGFSFLQTAAGAGKDGQSTLDLNPVKDAVELGYNTGDVRLVYNFINNLYSPSNKNPLFYIESISSDRQELRLLTTQLPNLFIQATTQGIKDALDADSYFSEFRLNFLNNNNVVGINISTEEYRGRIAVLVKLYKPLPASFRVKDTCSIVEYVSDPVAYEVISESIPDEEVYVPLAGPNFEIDVEDQRGTPSPFYDYDELFSYPISSSYYELMALASESGSAVSIDHQEYEQFVHFSSAEERLRNFKYKLELIQYYNAVISDLRIQNEIPLGQQYTTGSIEANEKLIAGIVNNFDHYDRYLYFESSSTAWPKSDSSRPYTLVNSTDSIATNWFADNIASASNYDASNLNSLTNAIPAFIREDSDNNELLTFIYMLGQHFDNIWIYQKALGDKYDGDNRLNYGVSRDLVADALKSFGVKLYSSNESLENLFSYFTGQAYQSGSLNANATHVTASLGDNSYLQPMPKQAYTQEVYKRLYHNLSYLLKTKGTERGLRALITCYGIPSNILNINTQGFLDKSSNVYLSHEDSTTASFTSISSSLDSIVIDQTGSTIEGFTLSQYVSVQSKGPDRSNALHTLEVGFSPADNINYQIHTSASDDGGLNIDNLIGSPSDAYSAEYTGLEAKLNEYTKNNDGYDLRDFINLIRFYDNTLFKSIKDYIPARSNASVGVIIKPNVLDRSKVKQVSGSMSDLQYTGSKSMYTITGSHGGATADRPYFDTASYTLTVDTPSGSALYSYHNFENAKFDGEYSGSTLTLTSQSLNPGNTFKHESGLNLLFDYDFFDASFVCNFQVRTFVPISVTPSITPTISVSPTRTPAISNTPSITPTISVTPSITPSVTPTISVTPSPSITPSVTSTVSPTRTPSISVTPTISLTATPSRTPGVSLTPSISISKTPSTSVTPSISISKTPSVSVTPSVTPTISISSTPAASVTPSRTPVASPTRTPAASVTPSRTPSISVSRTPSVSVTPSISISRTPSISVTPSISISKTPSVTPSTSALNLTQFSAGFGLNENEACFQSESTFWHDGNGTYPVNGDGIYNSAAGGPVLDGYYAWQSQSLVGYVNNSTVVSVTFCCFVEGTMISINGSQSVAIETLVAGDSVLSKNIPTMVDSDDPVTLQNWSNASISGSASTALVVSNVSESATEVYNVNDGLIKMTAGHLNIVKRSNVWTIVRADNLQVGDIYEDKDGNEVSITSVVAEAYSGLIYKLNVETDDVYYANGILTHNIK